MVCYNDYPLGPCGVCLTIGGYNLLSDDGKWIIGFLCEEHKDVKGEATVKRMREERQASLPNFRVNNIKSDQKGRKGR